MYEMTIFLPDDPRKTLTLEVKSAEDAVHLTNMALWGGYDVTIRRKRGGGRCDQSTT